MEANRNKNKISTAISELNKLKRRDEQLPIIRFSPTPYYRSMGPVYPFSTTKLQMNLNPRYISKISNSPRKVTGTLLRMRPYFIPERSRTKSENADTEKSRYQETVVTANGVPPTNTTMMDTSCDSHGLMETVSNACNNVNKTKKFLLTKKSKSLEDVRAENLDGSQPSHEMEFVSSRIQKLKVQD